LRSVRSFREVPGKKLFFDLKATLAAQLKEFEDGWIPRFHFQFVAVTAKKVQRVPVPVCLLFGGAVGVLVLLEQHSLLFFSILSECGGVQIHRAQQNTQAHKCKSPLLPKSLEIQS
jgi:hypothetical protein